MTLARYACILQIRLYITQPRRRRAAPRHGQLLGTDKKEFDGRVPMQGDAPHARKGVVDASELCR